MPSRRRAQLAVAVAALALGVRGAEHGEHDARDARELKHCDPGDEDCGGKSGGKSKGQGNGQGQAKGHGACEESGKIHFDFSTVFFPPLRSAHAALTCGSRCHRPCGHALRC